MPPKILAAPTAKKQAAALDTLLHMILTGTPMAAELPEMIETLRQAGAGQRVANILVMLAGAAIKDRGEWIRLLQAHIDGATKTDERSDD
jgi:Tfp pilus assembly protein PilO